MRQQMASVHRYGVALSSVASWCCTTHNKDGDSAPWRETPSAFPPSQ